MNKRLLVCVVSFLFIIALSNNIFAWAFDVSYPDKYQNFVTHKIIKNEPIKYYIKDYTIKHYPISPKTYDSKKYFGEKPQIQKDLSQQLTEQEREIKVKEAFEKGFKLWFDDTRKAIANAGRSSEFKDIKSQLSPSISFAKVSAPKQADIIIEIKDNPKNKNNWEIENNIVTIYNLPVKQQARLAQSFLGLAQEDTNILNSIAFSCYLDIPTFSKGHLTCASVDGFINLIDFTLSKTKGWSDRAQNGWTSFCAGKKDNNNKPYLKFEYKKAQPVNIIKRRFGCLYAFEEGKIEDLRCLDPFNFYKTQQTFNDEGLVKTMDYGRDHFTYDYSDKDNIITINSYSDDSINNTRPFYKDYKIKMQENFEENRYDFNHVDKDTTVFVKKGFCEIRSELLGEYNEYYTFKGSVLLFHDTFMNIAPHVPTIKVEYAPVGCRVSYSKDGTGIADIPYNAIDFPLHALKDFSNKYQLDKETEDTFIKEIRKGCTKPSSSKLNYFKEICSYFRKVTDYFSDNAK